MLISSCNIPRARVGCQKPRVGSKKSVQQGHSHFDARSVLVIREHGKMARTPLAAFFNRPSIGNLSADAPTLNSWDWAP